MKAGNENLDAAEHFTGMAYHEAGHVTAATSTASRSIVQAGWMRLFRRIQP
jgi:YD repeat-containing protein